MARPHPMTARVRYLAGEQEEPQEPQLVEGTWGWHEMWESQSPQVQKEKAIEHIVETEKKIEDIFKASPIVEETVLRRPKGAPPYAKMETTVSYYEPTPEQTKEIIKLAEQLPPETAAKYVTMPEPVAQKGIAETIMEHPAAKAKTPLGAILGIFGVEEPTLITINGKKITHMGELIPHPALTYKQPVQYAAGVIASAEAPVYSVAKIIGFEAPKPPPTLSGAVVSAVLGDPREMEQLKRYGKSYAAGSVLGDVVLTYVGGELAGKAWSAAKKVPIVRQVPYTAEYVTGKVTRAVTAPIQKAWRGSRMETWLIQHSGRYAGRAAKGISPGIISLPDISKMDKIGLEELIWKSASFDLTTVPRTSGAWITTTTKATAKQTPAMLHLISRGGGLGIGYLRETWFVKPTGADLLVPRNIPLIEVQKQTFRYTPYIPELSSKISRGSILPWLMGAGAVQAPKILGVTAVQEPMLKQRQKPKRIVKRRAKKELQPQQRSAADVVLNLGHVPFTTEISQEKTVLVPSLVELVVQAPGTRTVQVPSRPIWPQQPSSVFRPPYVPKRRKLRKRKKKKTRRKKTKFGRYEILYPVATTGQVGEWVLGRK